MAMPSPPPPPRQEYVASDFSSVPQSPPTMQSMPQYPQAPGGNDYAGEPIGDDSYAFKQPDSSYSRAIRYINIRYQLLLDTVTPYRTGRWIFSIAMLMLFMLRIVLCQGWYIICYGLSIYYLNLFIGFLSPKIDPAFQSSDEDFMDDGPMLPTRSNDEFRPFIRRLPEFKFWLSATKATLISIFLTFFEIFDLPVFWPILVLYFILLFISTMRQQIRHMIKYGYVPWDKGKKKYGQSEVPSSLFSSTI